MNFLNIFEDRVAGIFGAAQAPFSFKKLAKQAAREMEDQTLVINGINTAPALYTVLIAADDDQLLAPYYSQLASEVTEFVRAQAEKKRYRFVGTPLVRFMIDPSLKPGKFSVFAENVDAPTLARLYEEERAYLKGASGKATPAPTPIPAPAPASAAGAVPVAAVMFGKVDTSEKKTVCVVSGGNVDVTTLSRIITKGLSKAGRIAEISTKVADKPGSLLQLLKVVADSGANILSINHAREDQHSDVGACMVSMVLETRDAAHVEQIRRELTAMGYELEKE